jgi:hypothetical protein
VLLFAIQEFDFQVDSISDGLGRGFSVLLLPTIDSDVHAVRFYLFYLAHLVKPYRGICL